jgi:hypothetical protein
LASEVLSVTIARSNALIRVILKTLAMSTPFVAPRLRLRTCPLNEGIRHRRVL